MTSFIKYLKSIRNKIINRLQYKKIFVHMADLMMPRHGKISRCQLLIVSRIIDLENYLERGDSSFSHQENIKVVPRKEEMTPQVLRTIENKKQHWIYLIDNLDRYGFNPDLSRVWTVAGGGKYFLPWNGTHRLAWSYIRGIMMVPIEIFYYSGDLTDGEEYYITNHGISQEGMAEWVKRYYDVLNSIETSLFGYLAVDNPSYEEVKKILSKHGTLKEYEPAWISPSVLTYKPDKNTSKRLKKVEKEKIKLKLFLLKPYEQDLYWKCGKIHSRFVEKLDLEIKALVGKNIWGGLCESVTESTLVRPFFEVYVYENLYGKLKKEYEKFPI